MQPLEFPTFVKADLVISSSVGTWKDAKKHSIIVSSKGYILEKVLKDQELAR